MNVICEAATFALLSKFGNNKKVKDYPMYELSNKNNALKRVLRSESKEGIYIKRALYGRKAELSFLNVSPQGLHNNKVYFIYDVIDLLKIRYAGLMDIQFKMMDISRSIGDTKGSTFIEAAISVLKRKPLNFVNLTKGSEYKVDFNDLVQKLSDRTGIVRSIVSDEIKNDANNIVLIHNKEYYEQNGYDDPHLKLPSNAVIQCVTIEDSLDKIIDDKDAIINTIIKELAIKRDILFGDSFSLDEWQNYGFASDWIFGKEKDGKHYFMVVHPNGTFEFSAKLNDYKPFSNQAINKLSRILAENKGKEKVIIADADSNINILSHTGMFTLPDKDIFNIGMVSRNKTSRETNFAGVVDINLFETEGELYYNVGIRGYGMRPNIPHPPLLYKIERVESSRNMMLDLLETMSVEFVKYKSFTILPYPIKYLNEWILMCNQTN